MPFISLVPPWRDRIDSSLSFMVSAAASTYASEALWIADGRGRLDEEALRSALRAAEKAAVPVLLVGTALALLRLVELLEDRSPVRLPLGAAGTLDEPPDRPKLPQVAASIICFAASLWVTLK